MEIFGWKSPCSKSICVVVIILSGKFLNFTFFHTNLTAEQIQKNNFLVLFVAHFWPMYHLDMKRQMVRTLKRFTTSAQCYGTYLNVDKMLFYVLYVFFFTPLITLMDEIFLNSTHSWTNCLGCKLSSSGGKLSSRSHLIETVQTVFCSQVLKNNV